MKTANFHHGGWDSLALRGCRHKAVQEEGTEVEFSYFSPFVTSSIVFLWGETSNHWDGWERWVTPRGRGWIDFASGCNSRLPPSSHPVQMKKNTAVDKKQWDDTHSMFLRFFITIYSCTHTARYSWFVCMDGRDMFPPTVWPHLSDGQYLFCFRQLNLILILTKNKVLFDFETAWVHPVVFSLSQCLTKKTPI